MEYLVNGAGLLESRQQSGARSTMEFQNSDMFSLEGEQQLRAAAASVQRGAGRRSSRPGGYTFNDVDRHAT